MRLYHGSNTDIDTIDLDQGSQYKDFGKGFYLTPDKETAIRMAKKRSRLFGGVATLIAYEFDESAMSSGLNIKQFPEKSLCGMAAVYRRKSRQEPPSSRTRIRHCYRSNSRRRCCASAYKLP